MDLENRGRGPDWSGMLSNGHRRGRMGHKKGAEKLQKGHR